MPPPAGNPITIRIGRDGKICAGARLARNGVAAAPSKNLRRVGEAEAFVIHFLRHWSTPLGALDFL
jgi:hypothetical protein